MSVHWYRLEYQDFLGYQSIHYNPITVGMSSTLNCIWIVRYIYMVITIYLITGPASSTCGWTNIITMENIYFVGGGRRGRLTPWSWSRLIYIYQCNLCRSPMKCEFDSRSKGSEPYIQQDKVWVTCGRFVVFTWTAQFSPPIKLTTTI